MPYRIDRIEGIGASYRERLDAADIKTTADLLARCATARGRKELAAATGLSEKLLLGWSNMADMMRVSGVGPQYAELLERAGVDTVKELRTRNAENLAAKMKQINAEKKLARSTPAVSAIERWIAQARTLNPTISH